MFQGPSIIKERGALLQVCSNCQIEVMDNICPLKIAGVDGSTEFETGQIEKCFRQRILHGCFHLAFCPACTHVPIDVPKVLQRKGSVLPSQREDFVPHKVVCL